MTPDLIAIYLLSQGCLGEGLGLQWPVLHRMLKEVGKAPALRKSELS